MNDVQPTFNGTFNREAVHLLVRKRKLSHALAWYLAVISSYDSMQGIGCFASYKTLAEWFGCKRRAAIDGVTRLKKLGYIKFHGRVCYQGTYRNVIRIDWSYINKDARLLVHPRAPALVHPRAPIVKSEKEEETLLSKGLIIKKVKDMNGVFFDELVESPRTYKGYKFDHYWSEQLRIATTKVGNGHIKRNNLKKWEHSFRAMRTKDEIPIQEIDDMVEWYCAKCTTLSKPKLCHAANLRTNWKWLNDLKNADLTWGIEECLPILEDFKNIRSMGWKGNFQEALYPLMARTYKAFLEFRSDLSKLAVSRPEFKDNIEHYKRVTLNAESVTKHWFEKKHDIIAKFNRWGDDPVRYGWFGDVNDKALGREIIPIMSEYSGDGKVWYKIQEALRESR